uniref:Secreted protein n=1 Tax=Macrostomum lignano TaxID=282301 RepID=A0A1I8HP56_9PLAT
MEPSCQSGCRYALLLLLVLQTLLLVATPAAVRAAPVLTEDELEEPDGLNEMLLESERLNEEKRSLEAIRQFGGQLSENAIPFRRPPQLPPRARARASLGAAENLPDCRDSACCFHGNAAPSNKFLL